jgi:hypothetical protein
LSDQQGIQVLIAASTYNATATRTLTTQGSTMKQLRFIILSAILLTTAGAASAQDEQPIDLVPQATKAPEQSLKPFLFSVACIGLALGFMAVLATVLTFAYRANKISGPTVCFIVGGVLLLSPVYGVIVSYAAQFLAAATMPVGEGAPNPKAMASHIGAFLPLTLFTYATFLAAPFGVVAIVAAFFFKKSAS